MSTGNVTTVFPVTKRLAAVVPTVEDHALPCVMPVYDRSSHSGHDRASDLRADSTAAGVKEGKRGSSSVGTLGVVAGSAQVGSGVSSSDSIDVDTKDGMDIHDGDGSGRAVVGGVHNKIATVFHFPCRYRSDGDTRQLQRPCGLVVHD